MDISILRSDHATASPVSDAPCAPPAAGVTRTRAGNLNSRKSLHLACWNVRTLLDPGSQCITIRSLHDYQIDIACLSEVRIPNSGTRRIKVPGVDANYWLYHSGPSDNSGLHGVAFAISGPANNALMAWEPISPRIAVARFRGSLHNTTIIAVYAPTNAGDAAMKDEFYDKLQNTVNRVPRRDVLFIAGDWNARTGPSDDFTRHVLGKFGLGHRCENGDRLVNFADFNRLVVCSTRFQHPKKHLLTWYSNDGRTAHQIDHILVRSRWISSVEDCRAYRGAETGNKNGTDHILLRARFKIHLTKRHKTCPPRRPNVAALEMPEKQQALTDIIASRLVGTVDEQTEDPVDSQWSTIKTVTKSAILDELGTVANKQKDWISERTLLLSNKAREARVSGNPDHRRLQREATRSARADRNRYWVGMANSMENASHVGDFGKLFRLIRNASGRRCLPEFLLRDEAGQFIPEQQKKIERWAEHFDRLLNRPPSHPTGFPPPPQQEHYDISCDPPSQEEIAGAVMQLKNKKAAGEDGIPPEVFKYCLPALITPLHALFCSIWENEIFPEDWGKAILLPIPKKGDKTVCDNYRGISLIDIAAKIFSVMLLNRFSRARDARTRPNQGGFRRGRGCVDQIFTLRRVLEHRYKYQQPTVACFIDFRTAFDSINRDSLWTVIKADGLPDKLVRLMRAYYSATHARVRVYGEESPEFPLKFGVRQGCPLSPVLFNYAIDWTMEQALVDYPGVQMSNEMWISDLEFADDIVVLGDSPSALQPVLDRIESSGRSIGLIINSSKTKVLSTCPNMPNQCLSISGEPIEQVDSFKYLGSTLLPNGQAKEEIVLRTNNARSVFLQLRRVLWARSEISLRTKLQVFRAAIRPVLMYGCETWPLRAEDTRRLEVFDHWCLRQILKVDWHDKITNNDIRRRCENIERLSDLLQRRRLQWFGHVLRRENTELSKQALHSSPCPGWRCRLGGQLKTWISTVKADMDRLKLYTVYGVRQWNNNWLSLCAELTADRRSWSALIRDIQEADSSSRRR